jgi:hypothetical protein
MTATIIIAIFAASPRALAPSATCGMEPISATITLPSQQPRVS